MAHLHPHICTVCQRGQEAGGDVWPNIQMPPSFECPDFLFGQFAIMPHLCGWAFPGNSHSLCLHESQQRPDSSSVLLESVGTCKWVRIWAVAEARTGLCAYAWWRFGVPYTGLATYRILSKYSVNQCMDDIIILSADLMSPKQKHGLESQTCQAWTELVFSFSSNPNPSFCW